MQQRLWFNPGLSNPIYFGTGALGLMLIIFPALLGALTTAKEYEVALDPVNADPDNPAMDRPHFLPLAVTDKIATIEKADVERATMFLPTHSAYFASYFTITGLHGLHVLGGVLVFIYMWLPVSKKLYQRNPEHLANRVEVSGLFWHFVDLIWIFVFPLFYLL